MAKEERRETDAQEAGHEVEAFHEADEESLLMPYASDAQRRWAHTDSAKKAGFPTAEFDRASKGKKLPERKGKKKPPPRKHKYPR